MKFRLLFPYWSRFLGYACILAHVPIVAAGKMRGYGFHDHEATGNEGFFNSGHLFFIATLLLMVVGLFLIAFSKEKIEDEQISQLRLDSLQWAVYLNYLILVISLAFTDSADIRHILELNLWLPLLFFIIRFRWVIFRLNRSIN
jgi:hypothetical protein